MKTKDKDTVVKGLMTALSEYAGSSDNGSEAIAEVFSAWFSGVGSEFADRFMDDLRGLR